MKLLYTGVSEYILALLHQREITVAEAQMHLQNVVDSKPPSLANLPQLSAEQLNDAHADARRLNVLLNAMVNNDTTFMQALESHNHGAKFFNVAAAKQAIDFAEEETHRVA
jgi:hypothetical protein